MGFIAYMFIFLYTKLALRQVDWNSIFGVLRIQPFLYWFASILRTILTELFIIWIKVQDTRRRSFPVKGRSHYVTTISIVNTVLNMSRIYNYYQFPVTVWPLFIFTGMNINFFCRRLKISVVTFQLCTNCNPRFRFLF